MKTNSNVTKPAQNRKALPKALAFMTKARSMKNKKTFSMIAKELNAKGIKTPLGKKWTVGNAARTFNAATAKH